MFLAGNFFNFCLFSTLVSQNLISQWDHAELPDWFSLGFNQFQWLILCSELNSITIRISLFLFYLSPSSPFLPLFYFSHSSSLSFIFVLSFFLSLSSFSRSFHPLLINIFIFFFSLPSSFSSLFSCILPSLLLSLIFALFLLSSHYYFSFFLNLLFALFLFASPFLFLYLLFRFLGFFPPLSNTFPLSLRGWLYLQAAHCFLHWKTNGKKRKDERTERSEIKKAGKKSHADKN